MEASQKLYEENVPKEISSLQMVHFKKGWDNILKTKPSVTPSASVYEEKINLVDALVEEDW